MKLIKSNVVVLLLAVVFAAAVPGIAWADCSSADGIWLGHENMDTSTAWTFTLINLTNSNVEVGAKGTTDHDLATIFPIVMFTRQATLRRQRRLPLACGRAMTATRFSPTIVPPR